MSKIEWTGETWNPITGCTKISEGCKNCYAEKIANRLQKMGTRGYENGFKLTVQGQDAFDKPLKRKKPTMYFVCSMSDLFQDGVTVETIDRVMNVIEQCPQHTFQILTKRAEKMAIYFNEFYGHGAEIPKNVWLGVTVENQEAANERIPYLLKINASVRFLSCEPLLEDIDLKISGDIPMGINMAGHLISRKVVDWVIVGGESGHNARPMRPDWARSIRDQCSAAGVPFFFKQWGEWLPNCQIRSAIGQTISGAHVFIKGGWCYKVSKKKAGRLLDGVLHDAMPNV